MGRTLLVVAVSEQSEMVVKNDKVVSVRCDYQSELNVSDNDIDRIDESIGQLVNLTSLNCSSNKLTTLPDTIGNLVNLTHLDYYENKLTTLPDTIGNLVNLTQLNCMENRLTTLPDTIGNLVNLTWLICCENKLTTLPDTIGNLVNLTRLDCSWNKLTTLPDTIGNLVNLTQLHCWSNKLTTLPDTIGNLVSLTGLICYENQLTTLPDTIGNLANLTQLDCRNNQLSTLPETFVKLVNLKHLDCRGNQLTTLPETFGNLTKLKTFYCRKNLSNGRGVYWDNNQNCMLRRVENPYKIDTQITAVDKILNVSGRRITILFVPKRPIESIEILDLSQNELQALPKSLFEKFPNLKHLHIQGNTLSTLPEEWESNTLETLDCSFNCLVSLPDDIENKFPNLAHLNIAQNDKLEMLPEAAIKENLDYFCNGFQCTYMFWNRNQNSVLRSIDEKGVVKDITVEEVKNEINVNGMQIKRVFVPNDPIESIETLDLSQNGLQALPKSLFDKFPNLKHLHIQRNYLSKLPKEWKSNKLETLDCSSNRLVALPDNVENKFPKMKQLNVGNNDRLRALPAGLASIETMEELDITGCDLAPQLFESFAFGAKQNGINIECVNRKPISKLVTKIAVCSSLLLLSIWACVFTLPEVGLKFNTPTMICTATNATSDTDVGALVDVCNSICFNDQFEQLLQSEETENCLSTCKMTTLVQLQLSQRTSESGTRNSSSCVSNDTESSWTPLTIFRLFATFVSVVFLLPELIDSGMMAWLFWRTRFSGTMLDTFERGNLLSQASEMLQDSWTYNYTGIWLSLLVGFWRVPCTKTEFKKENTSDREWVDYLAILASIVDFVQTWALVPLSVGVVMTSSSFAEVIVNVVAVSVFSTLDDVFVEKIHKPQESLLNRWELYSGSKTDLVRLGKLTLNRSNNTAFMKGPESTDASASSETKVDLDATLSHETTAGENDDEYAEFLNILRPDVQDQDAKSEVQKGDTEALPITEVSDQDDSNVHNHDKKVQGERGSSTDAPEDDAVLNDKSQVETEIISDQHSLAKTEPEKGANEEHVVIDIHEDVPHPSEPVSQSVKATQSTEPVSQPIEAVSQSSKSYDRQASRSQPSEPVSQPNESMSQSSEALSQPRESTSQSCEADSQSCEADSQSCEADSQSSEAVSQSSEPVSQPSEAISQAKKAVSQSNDTVPQPTGAISQSSEGVSKSSAPISQSSETDSQSNEPIPQSNEATSQPCESASPPSQSNAQSNEATSQSDVLDGMSTIMNGSGIQPKIQDDAAPTTGSVSRKSLDETVSDNNDENAQTQDVNSMKLVNQANNSSIDSAE